jgi:[ribosomal protein S5]-alanine N-acetyltransferase
MARVVVQQVRAEDGAELIAANRASVALHEPWVYPFHDRTGFLAYLSRCDGERSIGYVVRDLAGGRVAGIVNLNEIVRGVFQSAYLGYYGLAGMTGSGLMREAVGIVVARAFSQHGLHRLEANVQPENKPSKALVQALGFQKEGYSPRYLKIGGQWRDHERWAILAEEWRPPA